jgi:hypothetical protein
MNKFQVDDKVKVVCYCRNWVYKSKKDKKYTKQTQDKDKCHIKACLEKDELKTQYLNDVLYFMHMNLDPEKQKSIEVLNATITMLKKKIENIDILHENWEINEKDRIKREYEKTFEDKYAVGQVAELEIKINNLYQQNQELRNINQKQGLQAEHDELLEKYGNLAAEKGQLIIDMIEIKKKYKTPIKESKWQKRANKYKKLYTELLEQQTEGSDSSIDSF